MISAQYIFGRDERTAELKLQPRIRRISECASESHNYDRTICRAGISN